MLRRKPVKGDVIMDAELSDDESNVFIITKEYEDDYGNPRYDEAVYFRAENRWKENTNLDGTTVRFEELRFIRSKKNKEYWIQRYMVEVGL